MTTNGNLTPLQPHRVTSDAEPTRRDGGAGHGRRMHFLAQYLRNPRQIGAIWPSSPALGAAMARQSWLDEAQTIVELGPGDGPVTAVIRERLAGRERTFFALEINESMCARLRERFPDLKVHCDSAGEMRRYLKEYGALHADCVISSIPWAAFPAQLQTELMAAIIDAMAPGGRFVTFTYVSSLALPAGVRFRRFLERNFASVKLSPVVWKNFPPAAVYECIKTGAKG